MSNPMFGMPGEVGGELQAIQDCSLKISKDIFLFYEIPKITDSKSASYTEQTIFGRSSPLRSYSHSGSRKIGLNFHVYNTTIDMRATNHKLIRAIASCVHPSYDSDHYAPPPICQLKCGAALSGDLFDGGRPINVLIESYSFDYGDDVLYDDKMMPFVIAVALNLDVVYSQAELPGRADVIAGNF